MAARGVQGEATQPEGKSFSVAGILKCTQSQSCCCWATTSHRGVSVKWCWMFLSSHIYTYMFTYGEIFQQYLLDRTLSDATVTFNIWNKITFLDFCHLQLCELYNLGVLASGWLRPSLKFQISGVLPCLFMAVLACLTASQGQGMSRKTASATPLTPNPSWHTSWFLTVTRWSTRCSLNSSATFSARCWWNSTVWRWPVGAMVRRMAWESEPLPVPATETPHGERIQFNLI